MSSKRHNYLGISVLAALVMAFAMALWPVSALAEGDLKTELGITTEDVTVTEISEANNVTLTNAALERYWGLYAANALDIVPGRIHSACHIASTADPKSPYVTLTMNVPEQKSEVEGGDEFPGETTGWAVLALVDGELVTYPTEKTDENKLIFTVRLGEAGTDLALASLTDASIPLYFATTGDWGTLTLQQGNVIKDDSLGWVRPYTLTLDISEGVKQRLQNEQFLYNFDLVFYLNSVGLKIDAESISFSENPLFQLDPEQTEKVSDGCYKFTASINIEAWKEGNFTNAVGVSYAAPNAESLLFEGELQVTLPPLNPWAGMFACVPLALTVVQPESADVYHKITVAQTDGGKIEPHGVEGEVWVKDGENQAFTITPDTGYEIVDVLVDNQSMGAISNHTFENVSDDSHTISATFQRSGTVTITPANITVYTGGEGYTGVVDGEGQMTTTANGLPEPGYYITLPGWMNEELGGHANAENLSGKLVLTYADGNGGTKEWNLSLYGTAAHSTDVAGVEAARYIYRIVPGDGTENIPVRLQLTDPENKDQIISSDEFVPRSDEQYKAYDMRIYTDEVTADKVTAKITIDDQTYTCKVEGTEGKLVVRGLTGEDITTDIVNSESQLSGSNISALAPADVTYYVNGSKVEVSDKDGVKLLVDDVLSDGVLEKYIQQKMTDDIPAGNYTYEEKYLDLVDTKNGNAYLTLGEDQKMTMYWPVPSDMNTSKNFYIVHFEALDRNYKNMEEELDTTPPKTVTGTSLETANGTQYIKFETGSFSPFVLVYEKTTGGGGGTTRYTITAEAGDGGSISPSGRVSVTAGADQTFTITPDEGNKVRDVVVDGTSVGALGSYSFDDVRGDHTISVTFTRGNAPADPDDTGVSGWFETGDHDAFLHGYDDGTGRFGPEDNMTRGEAAQMFYNMLRDKSRGSVAFDFEDLPEGAWYHEAVATLASHGILLGTSPTTVEPERPITRAEFTAMAMRFSKGDLSGENIFTDVSEGDWYYGVVVGSIKYGWISGYDDGTGRFGPNDNITRAQATIIANRMLGRVPDGVYINAHLGELTRFPDVSEGFYAFRDIVEATNSHDYSKDGGFEHWSRLR